jgi:hypothetical protein
MRKGQNSKYGQQQKNDLCLRTTAHLVAIKTTLKTGSNENRVLGNVYGLQAERRIYQY